MPNQYLNPPELFASQPYGFSQLVVTEGRRTVYLSGQVGWDAQQVIVDPHDLGLQTRRALDNIERALQAAGGTRHDVVSLRLYIVGEHIQQGTPVKEALLNFFDPARLPASSWIGVSALAHPDFLIEIEAVAVLG